MSCPICRNTAEPTFRGSVEYYEGFPSAIQACSACGCWFTSHNEQIHATLHAQPNSSYGDYRELAERVRLLFSAGAIADLTSVLAAFPKYQFVMESINRLPVDARVLELGCSWGYLTSLFIASGRDILGADVSPDAIQGATRAFGNHFALAGDPSIEARAPYDAIYHVGTIGCVSDPVAFTYDCLRMLRPGGVLLFNAPNRDYCSLPGQLWIDQAPPPDLVTLFAPGFWKSHFGGVADVFEDIGTLPKEQSAQLWWKRTCGRAWVQPQPLRLDASKGHYVHGRPARRTVADAAWDFFERGLLKMARVTKLDSYIPAQPSPFGIFVRMIKR